MTNVSADKDSLCANLRLANNPRRPAPLYWCLIMSSASQLFAINRFGIALKSSSELHIVRETSKNTARTCFLELWTWDSCQLNMFFCFILRAGKLSTLFLACLESLRHYKCHEFDLRDGEREEFQQFLLVWSWSARISVERESLFKK